MKEKIQITINNLDNIEEVLDSLELLFRKLLLYYSERDLKKLKVLLFACAWWFGEVLRLLGYNEKEFPNE